MKIMHGLLLILVGLVILNATHVFYFNIFTHSLPYGIYIKTKGLPKKDDYAATCLTPQIVRYGIQRHYLESGNCETGTVLVLKKIKGLPGNNFVVKNNYLEINGNSYRIIDKDSTGRPLKRFYDHKETVVDKGRYILLSDFVSNSWDSRYWGPVGIQFLLRPWWLFEKGE